MIALFYLLDIFFYAAGLLLLYKKKDLILVYLPFLFFLRVLIGPDLLIRPLIYNAFIFLILLYLIYGAVLRKALKEGKILINAPALLLLIYTTLLFLFHNHSYAETRTAYIALSSLFIAVIVAPQIFKKYGYERVMYELYKMSALSIFVFVPYVFFLTFLNYHPQPMYSNISFVSNGYIFAADVHALPIFLFVFGYYRLKVASSVFNLSSLFSFVIIVITLILIILMLRRAAMLVSLLAVIALIANYFFSIRNTSNIQLFLVLLFIIGIGVFISYDRIYEGVQFRSYGSDRENQFVSTDEGRFVDHYLVYDDMFNRNEYSKLIGFSFFNAPGNYGQGIFGDRNLHADLAVIAHSLGLIGLLLYLYMVTKLFIKSFRNVNIIIWLFLISTFVIFTITGRITNAPYATSFFLLLIWTTMPKNYLNNEEKY
ncbi:MAG: hypothetical protein LAT51_09700 [Flavobacteriaceae bacterium]|nr:hypothetical protein [Flavobacteriaceae bacterium]